MAKGGATVEISLEKYEEMQDRIANLETAIEIKSKQLNYALDLVIEQDDVIYALRSKQPHWISVKDRLPEDEGLVLAFGVGGIVIAEHYRFGQWVIFMLDKDGRYMSPYPTTIYYWMPLPEPPEEAKVRCDRC